MCGWPKTNAGHTNCVTRNYVTRPRIVQAKKLLASNRELTVRHGLRRRVNELILSVKFTSSTRDQFSAEVAASG